MAFQRLWGEAGVPEARVECLEEAIREECEKERYAPVSSPAWRLPSRPEAGASPT